MKDIYGIYGASGFGKEVLPLLKKQISPNQNIFFLDDNRTKEKLSNHSVLSFEEFLNMEANKNIVVAIANSKIREKITNKCIENNINIFNVVAENAVLLDDVDIKDGSILCSFTTITSSVKIGKSFHANIYSYVAHDCKIGDYVTFAPCVKCNGNVHIDDHVYIGTGAIIHQGKINRPLKIGKNATIAAGSVVTRSVPEGMTVFGNPAIEFTIENIKKRL